MMSSRASRNVQTGFLVGSSLYTFEVEHKLEGPVMTDEFKGKGGTQDAPDLTKANLAYETRERRRQDAKRKSAEFKKAAGGTCGLANIDKKEASTKTTRVVVDRPLVANCMQWLFAGNCKKPKCNDVHDISLRAVAGSDEQWKSRPNSPFFGHCTDYTRTGLCNTTQCRWNHHKMTWGHCGGPRLTDEDKEEESKQERPSRKRKTAPTPEGVKEGDDESPLESGSQRSPERKMSHLRPVMMRNPPVYVGKRPASYFYKPGIQQFESSEEDEGDEGDDESEPETEHRSGVQTEYGGSESVDSETTPDEGDEGEERDAESESKAEQRAVTQTERRGSESPELEI